MVLVFVTEPQSLADLWVVAPCSFAIGYHRFGGPFCRHLQDRAPNLHSFENVISPVSFNIKYVFFSLAGR